MIDSSKEISVQQTVSKFAGEEFDVSNVRTVFAGTSKDNMKRTDRVILLIGPAGSNKSSLIDCMCNYFYGAKFDDIRYKIADEIFDKGSTPIKSITKYVFNATTMPFRPIIIDTPEIASYSGIPTKEATDCMLQNFLIENQHIQISALCLVLNCDEVSINKDEEIIPEAISLVPSHMLPSTIILFSSNDEKPSLSPTTKLLLRHLNLNYNKYYFFNDYFLQHNKENKENYETEKQKTRLSWNLSMSELDRFCEQVRYLTPQKITDDFFNNDMSIHTQSSTKNISYERIIPIKLTGQQSTSVKRSTENWNLSETPVIKRYVYDPETMTHKPYMMEFQKEGNAGEYVNTQNFGRTIPTHKVHETLINDIPQENQILKKRQLPSDENGIVYMHMRSTPPPEYSTEVLHQISDHGEEGKAMIKKRISTMMDAESQQKALHSQYSKSPVQRQIAKRTSSGSEHSRSYGILPQQQQSSKNRQIKQTEQVITRLDDGILSTRNSIQSSTSQQLNDQEHRNYMVTSEMKRSKSPILKRLLMKKKKRPHSTSSADIQRQLDNSFEQPRALESSIEQSLQSPLRNYGRLIHDDEVAEQLQDRTIHLRKILLSYYDVPPNERKVRPITGIHDKDGTEKAGAGMKFSNERNQLLNVNQLSLEEGLTPHPYKTEPRIAVVNRKKDYSAERKKKLLKLLCFVWCPVLCVIAIGVVLAMLIFVL